MEGKKWTRRSFTTRGSDPTEVVEWRFGKDLMISEFQGIYQVHQTGLDTLGVYIHNDGPVVVLGEALHKQLEREWRDEQTFGDEDPVNMYGGE